MLQPTITRAKVYHLVDLLPETLLAEVARFIEFILYFRTDSASRKVETDTQSTWQDPFDEFFATFQGETGETIELSDQELVDLVHEVRQEKLDARGH